MRKRMALLFGVLYLFSCLSGCGSSNNEEKETLTEQQEEVVVQSRLVSKIYTQIVDGSEMSVTTRYDHETMRMESTLRWGEIVGSSEGLFEVDTQGRVIYEEIGTWQVMYGEVSFHPRTTEYYDNGTVKEVCEDSNEFSMVSRYNSYGLCECSRGVTLYYDITSSTLKKIQYESTSTFEYTEHNADNYPSSAVVHSSMEMHDCETDQVIETFNSESVLELWYDDNGRLTKQVDQDNKTTWQYDDQGNLLVCRYTEEEDGYWFEEVTTYIYE